MVSVGPRRTTLVLLTSVDDVMYFDDPSDVELRDVWDVGFDGSTGVR